MVAAQLPALVASFMSGTALAAVSLAPHAGSMSMWGATKDTLVGYYSEGSACKFADKDMGGLSAPTAQTPYIKNRKYCAVNAGMFGGGEICGACFKITCTGNHEQHLGRPGSTVIQVVDSGSWATFDCHMEAFKEATNYDTDIFPVTYQQVPCVTAGPPVVGVLDSDYYVTKLVFNNLHFPVQAAEVSISGTKYPLKLIGGWWHVWTGGVKGSSSFSVTQADGQHAAILGCFGGWENRRKGDGCSGNGAHLHAALAAAALDNETSSAAEAEEALAAAPPPETDLAATPRLRGAALAAANPSTTAGSVIVPAVENGTVALLFP